MASDDDSLFEREVTRIRAEYQRNRQASNLFPPVSQPILDMSCVEGETPSMIIWYEDGTELGRCVRLFDLPGTLSGDVLRLERNLPSIEGHCDIEGDEIRSLHRCLDPPPEIEDDFEDIEDLINQLPIVEVEPSRHFVKRGKYRSEIENLLRCQGGSCPGTVLSEHLVRLLGRSVDGQLVFPRMATRAILGQFSSLSTYKRWILHLVDAVSCLHSLGVVHRDLRIDNCLFADDGSRLVVCDLESRWGQRAAPEVALDGGLDSGWTTHSDIYDIGDCIKCMVYANAPITKQVEWPVPQPLQALVDACMRDDPDERPTLSGLRLMVEAL